MELQLFVRHGANYGFEYGKANIGRMPHIAVVITRIIAAEKDTGGGF